MMSYRTILLTGVAVLLSGTAFAQASGDVAYCNALSAKYREYIGRGETHADASAAMGQCASQPASAIPVLEKRLKDGKIELPKR
jgi:hypothetical protein